MNPAAELAGVYRHVGAGGTVMRPTNAAGPAMLFHNVKGHPGAKAVIGVVGNRKRVGILLGCPQEDLGRLLCQCAEEPIDPVAVQGPAPCQQVVHRAEDPDFDLFKLVPAPTNTPQDAGPYITFGMCCTTQAALLAFSAFPELKHVILVDEDVNIFDSSDVLWAMNTRFQGDRDIVTIPGVRCHPLDPGSDPAYSGSIENRGISCKTIFDCTVPFHLKDKFHRAEFMEVDPARWTGGANG